MLAICRARAVWAGKDRIRRLSGGYLKKGIFELTGVADGCLVNLSGGLQVLRMTGERISDLLCRLGGTASIPRPGEARRSRMADVPVLALSLRSGETLLDFADA